MNNIDRLEGSLTTRSARKVQSIVDNASRLFVQHGYHKVTMESISQYANVSKVTLYKYFEDKQALYEYILKQNYLKEYDMVVDIIMSDRSFKEKVKAVVEARIQKYYDKNAPIYHGEVTLSLELQKFIKEYRKKMLVYRSRLYIQGREEQYINLDVTDQTLEAYFKIIQHGIVTVVKDKNDFNNEKASELFNLLFAGILRCQKN